VDPLPEIYISNRRDWRDWLAANHADSPGIWLIYYKKHTGVDRVAYDDAVEEALCFGWIDSTVRRLDDRRYCQKFVPRQERSSWSALNRRRAEKLMTSGAMTPAGLAKIEAARASGAWAKALKDRARRPVPPELKKALAADRKARAAFNRLSPTQARYFKQWVAEAKKPETRERRAAKAVTMLREGKKWGI
jgi:uncharacterized protein YdeI (YjbR/CyaY-like superfamily)